MSSIVKWKLPKVQLAPMPVAEPATKPPRVLHRIREVRRQQGISLRSAAKRLKMDVHEVRTMERETSDLPLSMLYRWEEALEVPASLLLADDEEGLSAPVLKRARMIRLMKTAAAMLESSQDEAMTRLVSTLVDQLIEIMPELESVNAWHAVGQRRSLEECGRIAERQMPDDWFVNPSIYG